MTEHYLSDFISEPVFSDTILSYTKPKVAAKRVRLLKSGKITAESRLDLRGGKTEVARAALCEFISTQAKTHERCILIFFDKPEHSSAPPLIKNLLNQWLPQFNEVLAFHSAQERSTTHEAVFVLLKKIPHADEPTRLPNKGRKGSFLAAETKTMERKRRLVEQQGERQLAPVKARHHSDEEVKNGPEGELQNSILQHPELNSQRFDGIDPNLNPEPPLNSEARREFDNEKRQQEQEKQLRLGNMPKINSAPTPRGP